MEFKHSRAPWVAVINTDFDLPSGLIKSGDKSIAHTLQKAIGTEQARANTYLIAAAPELLEQLIRLRNKIASYKPDDEDDLGIVDTVIAKALGQQ
ncbi:hypothetical protein [Proteus phage PM2]|uniref:Uncharacterized protein n=1 Tax=Proteus phage PM2 TaxID=2025809 RepID=A0A249XWT3_9CAUD|nr:hypothetical protein KNT71_gp250 [Proteus phage PM2]ASZ76382.1 hypothetical protein [Proteus phage PM2]